MTCTPSRSISRTSLRIAGLALLAAPAAAHINLISPSGGETFSAGSVQTLRWEVLIGHDTQNWDLDYSTSGPNGPWISIVADLPPGNINSGAQHTFNWSVPDDPTLDLYVRVQQDNSATDYTSSNGGPIALIGSSVTDCNSNGVPDAQDNDFNGDGTADECQGFSVDVETVSTAAGGAQAMSLDAGPAFGGDLYLVLGSLAGTSPGTQLDGHLLPLNFDSYTVTSILGANGEVLKTTLGNLDGMGRASAAFAVTPGELSPALAGLELDHAFIVVQGALVVHASNAMPLRLAP